MRIALASTGVVVAAAIVSGIVWYVHWGAVAASPASAEGTSTTPYVVPALTKAYADPTYGFSLMMPADFSSTESKDAGSGVATIVLQDQSGNGIQIVISPFNEDKGAGYTLTATRIREDLPNLEIDDQQPVDIGSSTSGYVGLAFLSNNPAFDGSSREVWFVFRGNLYQISTYAHLDPLLQAIFGTWQFT